MALFIMNFKHRKLEHFFLKCFLFALLLFAVDRAVGVVISDWAKTKATDRRIGEVLSCKMDYELLVFGSSRAARNIAASEISKSIDKTSYNLGLPGSNIDFHTQLLELVIQSGKAPEFVILTVDNTELIDDPSIYFRYDVLYPYSGNESVRKILSDRSQLNDWFSRYSHTYREKHAFLESFRPHKLLSKGLDPQNIIKEDGSLTRDGWPKNHSQLKYSDTDVDYSIQKESSFLRENFRRFLTLCSQEKIQLFIVFTPSYGKPVHGLRERIENLVDGDGICLDYRSNPLFLNKKLFRDGVHLNTEGANLLSNLLGEDIKKYLSGK